jgi:hypothetical protein
VYSICAVELKPFVCSPVAGKLDMTYLANSGLINRVAGDWEKIAGLLGQAAKVTSLGKKNDDYASCSAVFQAWINNAGTEIYRVSWEGLGLLLRHESLNHGLIANELGL